MRFVLRSGSREVLFLSRDRFMQFTGLDETAEVLAGYLEERANRAAFRKALQDDADFEWLAQNDDVGLIVRVAQLLTQGRFVALDDLDQQAPWPWPLGQVIPPGLGGAENDGEADPLLDEEPGEHEDERTDEKPDPVIPPEFPRVAKREADAMEFQTELYNIKLDLMRFVGGPTTDKSKVAPEVVQIALGSGVAVLVGSKGTAAIILPLGIKASDLKRFTEVGPVLKEIARQSGFDLKGTVVVTGEGLVVFGKKAEKNDKNSALSPVFIDLAKLQGTTLGKTATAVGAQLVKILGPGVAVGATEVGPIFKEIANDQVGGLVGKAGKVGQTLVGLLGTPKKGGPLPGGAQPAATPAVKPLSEQQYQKGTAHVTFTFVTEGGQVVPNVVLKVKTSKGDVVEVQSDGSGKVELKDLPSGKFDIVSVRDEKALEVVDFRSSIG